MIAIDDSDLNATPSIGTPPHLKIEEAPARFLRAAEQNDLSRVRPRLVSLGSLIQIVEQPLVVDFGGGRVASNILCRFEIGWRGREALEQLLDELPIAEKRNQALPSRAHPGPVESDQFPTVRIVGEQALQRAEPRQISGRVCIHQYKLRHALSGFAQLLRNFESKRSGNAPAQQSIGPFMLHATDKLNVSRGDLLEARWQ